MPSSLLPWRPSAKRFRRRCLTAAFVLLGMGIPLPSPGTATPQTAEAPEARRIVLDADYQYATRFTWPCSAEIFAAAVDHPELMGALWNAYGFAPAYRVSEGPGGVHVVDPTGLVGDAVLYQRSQGSARYLVRGKLDHWAVPILNRGSAVFRLTWSETSEGVAADLEVFFKSESGLGSLVLRAVRPLLARHVENRVSHNLQDAARIAGDIRTDPAAVQARLPMEWREAFRAAFLP